MSDKTFRIKKNRDDVIRVLKCIIEVLNKYEIEYYLDFGTLIGAVREKGLIPWDDDIDISLLNEEDYKRMPEVLKEIKKRFNLRTYLLTYKQQNEKRILRNSVPTHIRFTDEENYQIAKVRTNKFWIFGRGQTTIDIFFKYKFKEDIYWTAFGIENSIPAKYLSSNLVIIDFCGLQCTMLKNYDEYLTYIYGDWKNPDENWIESDSKCLS